ncbi:uncharacterized protein RSE6_06463 [Rhynchosporium secalis]|uniref:Uncharacterized protein n=1 Tax=Rhynchosporium secalis TaxID=38038 RepID=A0A1E1MAH5_RHYSE|nr:uncharacterized protein RSE6_06463 [Rhynchosporium secalis]
MKVNALLWIAFMAIGTGHTAAAVQIEERTPNNLKPCPSEGCDRWCAANQGVPLGDCNPVTGKCKCAGGA